LSATPPNNAADQLSRAANALIAAVSLAFTLPLVIIVCIAIRLESPGPVFEGEPCIGRRGRRFRMLEFRTTVYAPDQRTASRPELTSVGSFLRYSRIDSLPQLLNVLAGDMSIIEIDGRSPSFLD
jgi:lipopolysaccharide/colanic/teichoic acid biosynthesis glycosyltransferase